MSEPTEIKADRFGNNGIPGSPSTRLVYLAHGKGYVMCRRPGAMPFVVTEKLWLSFPPWKRSFE
jgi:hypothetical protein